MPARFLRSPSGASTNTFPPKSAVGCRPRGFFFPQDCDHDLQGKPDFVGQLYRVLIEAIDRCDAVVAILDGPDSDSGTCVEIGYARALGKPIIGVRTDFRDGDIHGINVMSVGACSAIIKLPSTSGSLEEVAEKIVEALKCPA